MPFGSLAAHGTPVVGIHVSGALSGTLSAARVRLLAAVPSLDSLVRGGRVTPGQRRLADLLGVVPLLTLDARGRAVAGGAARGFPRACARLVEKAAKVPAGVDRPVFAVAHADAPELGERIAGELLARRPGAETWVVGVTPVLAAHAGPGAVAVATLGAAPRGRAPRN